MPTTLTDKPGADPEWEAGGFCIGPKGRFEARSAERGRVREGVAPSCRGSPGGLPRENFEKNGIKWCNLEYIFSFSSRISGWFFFTNYKYLHCKCISYVKRLFNFDVYFTINTGWPQSLNVRAWIFKSGRSILMLNLPAGEHSQHVDGEIMIKREETKKKIPKLLKYE